MTTMFAGPYNATTGRAADLIPTPTDDANLVAWEQGRTVTARSLVDAARAKMSRLLRLDRGWDGHRGLPTTPLAAMVLNGILNELVFDDAATPQIAPMPDGGIQVEWLVAGQSLEIAVTSDGTVLVTATDDGGGDLLDGDFTCWEPDFLLLGQARAVLEKISGDVGARLNP